MASFFSASAAAGPARPGGKEEQLLHDDSSEVSLLPSSSQRKGKSPSSSYPSINTVSLYFSLLSGQSMKGVIFSNIIKTMSSLRRGRRRRGWEKEEESGFLSSLPLCVEESAPLDGFPEGILDFRRELEDNDTMVDWAFFMKYFSFNNAFNFIDFCRQILFLFETLPST